MRTQRQEQCPEIYSIQMETQRQIAICNEEKVASSEDIYRRLEASEAENRRKIENIKRQCNESEFVVESYSKFRSEIELKTKDIHRLQCDIDAKWTSREEKLENVGMKDND